MNSDLAHIASHEQLRDRSIDQANELAVSSRSILLVVTLAIR
jgi:hypothetical protein